MWPSIAVGGASTVATANVSRDAPSIAVGGASTVAAADASTIAATGASTVARLACCTGVLRRSW
jgi:hypothetical protein